jgi:fatty acid desaturase
MAKGDFRSRLTGFASDEDGSARIALVLFGIALATFAVIAVLGATGQMQAPPLVYMVFGVIVLFAGWDAFRERRKARRDD